MLCLKCYVLGNDSVDGGIGDDLLIVDYSSNTYSGISPAAGISSFMSSNGSGGFDGGFSAYRDSSFNIDQVSFSNIDRVQITGTIANDNINTGAGNDIINDGTGNDIIGIASFNLKTQFSLLLPLPNLLE
jgi:hypothetical protein